MIYIKRIIRAFVLLTVMILWVCVWLAPSVIIVCIMHFIKYVKTGDGDIGVYDSIIDWPLNLVEKI